MAPIKKEQIIDDSKVLQAFKDISEAIKITIDEVKKLTEKGKELGKIFENTKSIKQYNDALKALTKQRIESEKITKMQLDLLKKEEELKQKQINTNNLIVSAAEKQNALTKKTQQEQAKLYQQRQKAHESRKKNLLAEQKLLDAKRNAEIREAKEAERQAKIAARQTREAAKLTSAYAQESKKLTELRNKTKDLAIELERSEKLHGKNDSRVKKLRSEYNKFEKQTISLISKLTDLDKRLGQGNRRVGFYTDGLKGLGKQLIGAFGVVGGVQMFATAIKKIITTSRDYEKANADLAAILGKTRKETTALQSESQRLGASTAFSASQVTELQTELARLGKSESDIIAMTGGIINATIALNSETGETAALVGATLNSFKKGADESSKVADVLTASTQKSALSFEKLNVALPISSSAAAAAEVSFETMVSQLAQAADRGIDASSAATSLRNIYIELANKGLTLEEAMNKINSSQDRLSTANELFGKRAAVTALALADTTDKTRKLEIELRKSGGTAEKVAKEQLNTFDGSVKLMNSAIEGLILSMSDSTGFNEFIRAIVDTVTVVATLLTALTNLETSYNKLQTESDELLTAVDELKKTFGDEKKILEDSDTARQQLIKSLQDEGLAYAEAKKQADEYIATIKFFSDETNTLKIQLGLLQTQRELLAKAGESTFEMDQKILSIKEKIKFASIDLTKATNEELEVYRDQYQNAFLPLVESQQEFLDNVLAEIELRKENTALIGSEAKARKEDLESIKSRGQVALDTEYEINETVKESQQIFDSVEQAKTRIFEEEIAKRAEAQKAFNEQLKESAIDIGNALFEIKAEKLEQETEKIQEEFDARLANEELDEEQRSLIEAQREQKENELERKKRENEKKQFLFNQGVQVAEVGIDTAKKVAEIQATAAVLAATPVTAAFAPIALAQIPLVIGTGGAAIAAILAKSIPAFDKGTENFPGLGWVAEKRPELVEKNGRIELFDKPTLLGKEYKGAKVTSGAETADILDNISRHDILHNISGDNDSFEGMMIANSINKAFAKHSDRMVNELRKNRPMRERDNYKTEKLRDQLRNRS